MTIKATSSADPSVSVNATPVAIVPDTNLSIQFVPAPPAQAQTDGVISLNAAVANDATHAGVDWSVCPNGCGFFTTRPATPEIKATGATSYVPAQPAVTSTTVSTWPNGLAIPYTAPHQTPSSGSLALHASAHADSTKTVTANIAISTAGTGVAISGTVQAGAQPVVGASIALYTPGTGGYASASTQISSTAVSDNNGQLHHPSGVCLFLEQHADISVGNRRACPARTM